MTALNSLLLYASDLLVMSLIECYINGVLQTYGSSGSSSNSNEEVYLEVDENEPEIKSSSHHSFQPQAKPSGVNFPSISDNIFMDENLENKYTDEKLEMIEKKRKESMSHRVQHSNTTEFNTVLSFFKTLERKKHK